MYFYNGITTISNGTFENNTNGAAVGGGTLNVTSGTVAGNTYGINVSGGRVNIGIKEGAMSTSDPVIIGEQYGMNVSGSATIALYDGMIKGKTGSLVGNISETETNYTSYEGTQDGYYVTYLTLSGTASTVATVNGIGYTSLQSAINACMDGEETTITLVNGTNLDSTLQIPENKKVILDVSGFAIRITSLDVLIQNAGELTIIDTDQDETGNITNTRGIAIENTGTLSIGQDDGTINNKIPLITGTTAVKTEGTFNFYDGLLRGTQTVIEGEITAMPDGAELVESEANGYKQNIVE